MRNGRVYITGSLIGLERIGCLAVYSMINGPYSGTFVYSLVAHKILIFRPMSFAGKP